MHGDLELCPIQPAWLCKTARVMDSEPGSNTLELVNDYATNDQGSQNRCESANAEFKSAFPTLRLPNISLSRGPLASF